jgi:GAF domain-containing protein
LIEDRRGGPGTQGQPSAEDAGTTGGEDVLAAQLSALARELQEEKDPDAMLDDIVRAAIALIPGTDDASISLVSDRRHIRSQAPSSELAARVDHLQDETGEGPCLDAAFEHQTVRVPDMAREKRWPRFASKASQLGVGGMLAFQLFVEGDNLGALNLYGRTAGGFNDESEHVGLLFASHAAVAFAGARRQLNLNQALDSRDLIGMAKGILMERFQLSADGAFKVLIRHSQESQRKLRDVAQQVVLGRR